MYNYIPPYICFPNKFFLVRKKSENKSIKVGVSKKHIYSNTSRRFRSYFSPTSFTSFLEKLGFMPFFDYK